MKKIFTILALAASMLTAQAKDYTDNISISLSGGEPTTQEATVAVDPVEGQEGTYNIVLKAFSFTSLTIGDVTIEGVKGTTEGDRTLFDETTKEATITNGGSIATMLGGKVTVTIKDGSCIYGDNLYLDIALPVAIFGQTLDVTATFGTKPSQEAEPKAYTDNLVVTAMGQTMPAQEATIYVLKQDNGKYTLTLKNFELQGVMKVGTIEMTDVEGTEENGVVKLSTDQTVTIQEGEPIDEENPWALAGVPVGVKMTADMTDTKLKADMTIHYEITPEMAFDIIVKFGYDASGISNATTTAANGNETYYDLGGRRINQMQKGINIVRKADGTTVKVIRK